MTPLTNDLRVQHEPQAVVLVNNRGEITHLFGPYTYEWEVKNAIRFYKTHRDFTFYEVRAIPFRYARLGGSANY